MTETFALLLSAALQIVQLGDPATFFSPNNAPCPTGQIVRNDINYYHGWLYSGECWLSYSKARSATIDHRSVHFTSDGSIMVFNSFEGRGGVYHGSRVFTTFPRDQAPSFEELKYSVRSRTATKGLEWVIDDAKKLVIKSKGANVTESKDVLLDKPWGRRDHKAQVLVAGLWLEGSRGSDFRFWKGLDLHRSRRQAMHGLKP